MCVLHKIVKTTVWNFTAPLQAFTLAILSVVHITEVAAQGIEQLPKMVIEKRYAQAVETINLLPKEQRQRLDIRFYLATSQAGSGNNSEAIKGFKQLIAEAPQHPEFYNNLAMLLVDEGKLLEAQQALESGLRSNENYAMLYNNLTVVFETMARRSYATALRVKREQSPILAPLLSLQGYPLPAEPAVTMAVVADQSIVMTTEVVANADMAVLYPPVRQRSDRDSEVANHSEPTPVTEVAVATQTSEQQIEMLLRHWIESWQRRDVEGYIKSYSANFKSRGYESHEAWRQGRSEKISRARKIAISIEQLELETLASDRVQVDFVMNYRSDRYSDRSKKRVVYRLIEGQWRIVRELTLAVMSS
jgi:hypothetical protein